MSEIDDASPLLATHDDMPHTRDVAVCICTYNRPEQLRQLLDAIADIVEQQQPLRRFDVVVVDDGSPGPARAVVDDVAARFSGTIHYRHVGSSNVAIARNTAITTGMELAPWLALVDDDCVPDPDWLTHLIEVQERTGADIVTGHVSYTTPPGAPSWLRDEPFCTFTTYTDGEEPTFGTTANAFVSSAFLRTSGVRFRTSLGNTGGEDMTFFDDVRKAGGRLRYSAKSVVYEELPPARQRLPYQLYRQMWLGNNMAEINRHTREWPTYRLVLRGGKWVVTAWTDALARLVRARPTQWRWALAVSLRGVGLILGVAGVRLKHRP
ncbi:MAG TPA: glycosyltransferase family 2 protein [Acidimicrobiales bacterium]